MNIIEYRNKLNSYINFLDKILQDQIIRDKGERSVMLLTEEEWYASFPLNMIIMSMVYVPPRSYFKEDSYKVLIKGTDDFGLETKEMSFTAANELFDKLNIIQEFTQEYLKKIGFKRY